MRTSYLVILLGLCAASACAPVRTPYLVPEEGALVRNGRTMYTDSAGGAVAHLAWESFTESQLVFRLHASNISAKPFVIDPTTCLAEVGYKGKVNHRRACDPEKLLDRYDGHIAQQQRTIRRDAGWGAALALLDLVGTVADATSKKMTSEQKEENERERANRNYQRDAKQAANQAQLSELENKKLYYSQVLLRANTLMPGEQVQGQVLFTRLDEGRDWTIRCAGPDTTEFTFRFSQTIQVR